KEPLDVGLRAGEPVDALTRDNGIEANERRLGLEQRPHAELDKVRPRQPIRCARRRGELPLERGAEDRSAEARVLAAEDEPVEEPAPPGVLFAVEAQDGPGADRPRMVV